jgi:hypothetical protein
VRKKFCPVESANSFANSYPVDNLFIR